MAKKSPLALIILDGFGYREATEANAIAAAPTPTWDKIWQQYPHTLLSGSGRCVGLPAGQMGNSEVGHMNMGAGRIVHQDLSRIDVAIETGTFSDNIVLNKALMQAAANDKAVHIMGLTSAGGVHAHENHILALLELTNRYAIPAIYIHAFLDGRDTPPQSADSSLQSLTHAIEQLPHARIASIVGRYYAMDRDKRWERVEMAYQLLVDGNAPFTATTALEGLEQAYSRGETDEFVKPTIILGKADKPARMQEGDVVIFMNFRADRAREITSALTEQNFSGFTRSRMPMLGQFVCLTEYDANYTLPVAFPKEPLSDLLTDCLSAAGLQQLRLAETEKYAHVTFFFNGGKEAAVPGEERCLIPSPKVATYDLLPEMSAYAVTDAFISAIESEKYDVIICNFANPDMVGHTGNFNAAVKAVSCIDTCLEKILAAMQKVAGEIIITADHGNVEQMYDDINQQPHTAHTSDPVPFVYIGKDARIIKQDGKLSDIAPTMLYLLKLKQPTAMTGSKIIELIDR